MLPVSYEYTERHPKIHTLSEIPIINRSFNPKIDYLVPQITLELINEINIGAGKNGIRTFMHNLIHHNGFQNEYFNELLEVTIGYIGMLAKDGANLTYMVKESVQEVCRLYAGSLIHKFPELQNLLLPNIVSGCINNSYYYSTMVNQIRQNSTTRYTSTQEAMYPQQQLPPPPPDFQYVMDSTGRYVLSPIVIAQHPAQIHGHHNHLQPVYGQPARYPVNTPHRDTSSEFAATASDGVFARSSQLKTPQEDLLTTMDRKHHQIIQSTPVVPVSSFKTPTMDPDVVLASFLPKTVIENTELTVALDERNIIKEHAVKYRNDNARINYILIDVVISNLPVKDFLNRMFMNLTSLNELQNRLAFTNNEHSESIEQIDTILTKRINEFLNNNLGGLFNITSFMTDYNDLYSAVNGLKNTAVNNYFSSFTSVLLKNLEQESLNIAMSDHPVNADTVGFIANTVQVLYLNNRYKELGLTNVGRVSNSLEPVKIGASENHPLSSIGRFMHDNMLNKSLVLPTGFSYIHLKDGTFYKLYFNPMDNAYLFQVV